MNESPYSEWLKIMDRRGTDNSPLSLRIATVTYVEETEDEVIDIEIELDGLPIDKDNMYISDFLLKGHMREIRTDGMSSIPNKQWVSGDTSMVNDGGHNAQTHNHSITNLTVHHTKAYTRDTLKKGDLVSVMCTSEEQTYLVLTRVRRVSNE